MSNQLKLFTVEKFQHYLNTVSYTHLDVYKRQILTQSLYAVKGNNIEKRLVIPQTVYLKNFDEPFYIDIAILQDRSCAGRLAP